MTTHHRIRDAGPVELALLRLQTACRLMPVPGDVRERMKADAAILAAAITKLKTAAIGVLDADCDDARIALYEAVEATR